jgi:hypothetical protein
LRWPWVNRGSIVLLDFSLLRCAWRALRRSRERADFWLWLWRYRHQSRPILIEAINKLAPQADLHMLRNRKGAKAVSGAHGWYKLDLRAIQDGISELRDRPLTPSPAPNLSSDAAASSVAPRDVAGVACCREAVHRCSYRDTGRSFLLAAQEGRFVAARGDWFDGLDGSFAH